MKEDLIMYLKNQTTFIDLDDISDIFTSKRLAEVFNVKRNTMSHYLNELVKEGVLVKINSRPVFFFHKLEFEKQLFDLKYNIYSTIDEINKEKPMFDQNKDIFSMLIGHDRSLNRIIEQIKTALYYPDNDLPVLISGESGTGKSYLVKIIYHYCLEYNLISSNSNLVIFNCAQYANNPELLTSNLFGHIEGAFTGANVDKKGAFESADGGILFLDEVHRLNPEGQEKLFTYMDQGIIYRMGDSTTPLSVKTRLFFATTENIRSTFLTTFTRRIPIQIELPSIKERSKDERTELVYSFLLKERLKVEKDIRISGQVINLLTSSSFKGNIGELKNIVKVIVARAFSEQIKDEYLNITIYHLPDSILNNSHQVLHNAIPEAIYLSETTTKEQLVAQYNPNQRVIINTFEKMIKIFKAADSDISNCDEQLRQIVDQLFDYLLFETDRQEQQELLLYLTKYIRDTFNQMENAHQIKFNGNSIYAISYYIFQRGMSKWSPDDLIIKNTINELELQIEELYPTSYYYMLRILELCRSRIDLDETPMDRIILTLYLKKADWTKRLNIPKAIIVAHGYSTASSMANVANRLLSDNIYESFDMPLDVSPKRIAEEILEYSEHTNISNGLVILVDMGSLKEIYEYFPKQITTPILIMNNVTTSLAIAVGQNLQQEKSLSDIADKASKSMSMDWEVIYPENNRPSVIITTCQTGIGTATHISHLLEKSLPKNSNINIIPYEYQILLDNTKINNIIKSYNIIGIIGTDNPNIPDIPYLSLEEVISGDKNHKLNEWLQHDLSNEESEKFTASVIRNFSLEKVIDLVTILDTDTVMKNIDIFMRELEISGNLTLENSKKLALYVHISCLIERLIRKIPINTYYNYTKLKNKEQQKLNYIKKSFSVIENGYSVDIPESEVAYIYDIVFKQTDINRFDEDF